MTWRDEQLRLRDALLAPEVDEGSWSALGGDPSRWLVYRRLVRGRMRQTLAHALPSFIDVVGAQAFDDLVGRFLAGGRPRSPYLRDLPGELLDFVASEDELSGVPRRLPPVAVDVARQEWAELEVAYEPDDRGPGEVTPLAMDAVPVLQRAHRLVDLAFPVHRAEGGPALSSLAPDPVTLCVYRDRRTHEVETLELTPIAATIVRGAQRGDAHLAEIVRNAAAVHGVEVDVPFVEALSELLATLVERGLLLGSLGSSEKSS